MRFLRVPADSMLPIRLALLGLFVGLAGPVAAQTKALDRAPRSANPYTAFLPAGVEPDYEYWDAALAAASAERSAAMARVSGGLVYDEAEGTGRGLNDTFADAELIAGFGTNAEANLTIQGGFADPFDGTPTAVSPFPEEDGSIGTASDTGLGSREAIFVQQATLGDGAFGATSGDFDFYAVTAPTPGFTLIADIDTPTGGLDPTLTLYNAGGGVIAFNDDDDGLDSFLSVELPAAGTYYVAVGAFASSQSDPTNPGSGSGRSSTGAYDLLLGLGEPDFDFFAFDLQAGDIIGVGNGSPGLNRVLLSSPDEGLRIASAQDASSLYPEDSPLPGGGTGDAAAAFVAPTTGRYRLEVEGSGPYQVGVQVFRPRLETDPVEVQTLFVDFDGATINAQELFGGGNANAVLSPLSAFVTRWGFAASQEGALIDAIMASLRETILEDLALSNNPLGNVRLLNSRDDADPFGQPGVSRLIVGGTIAESGIQTIGIASSIDVGNFGLEDTGIILLDLLSAGSGNPNSLNQFPIASGASKLAFVAQGVANITAHEAGHFLGLYHTEQFNDTPNIIDQGGNLANTVGVGSDNTFGTADDEDVDFVMDELNAAEGFQGFEDSANAIAFALSSVRAVATGDAPVAGEVRAFPSPLAAGARLRVEAGAGARAALVDVLGRVVARAEAGADGLATLATDGLAPGAYFVRVEDGEAVRVVPVTVVR